MLFTQPLLRARFTSRPNRFAAWAELNGQAVYCHMPNPGRMWELLRPDVELWVRPRRAPGRTTHEVVLARHGDVLVCLDSRLPPELFLEAVQAGLVPELGPCPRVQREVPLGTSRIDLVLRCATGQWLVEAKSCTLVVGNQARFPDAPTVRGARHLQELQQALETGHRTAVAFIIQRGDADSFGPNYETDPVFARHLRQAVTAGVIALAVRCEVNLQGVWPVARVPVDLTAG